MTRPRGFTLLEVLIALAIASIALVALFGAAAATVRTTDVIRERTFAHLVATNRIAELRARGAWPDVGVMTGDVELAGRAWRWRATVSATDDASIRRIDLSVDGPDGERAGALTGFLGRPQAAEPRAGR